MKIDRYCHKCDETKTFYIKPTDSAVKTIKCPDCGTTIGWTSVKKEKKRKEVPNPQLEEER